MKTRILCLIALLAVLAAGCKGTKDPKPQPSQNDIVNSVDTSSNGTKDIDNPQNTETDVTDPNAPENPTAPADKWAALGDEPLLKIVTTDGTMTVKLYSETPMHRDNFVQLAQSGFYDSLMFHRIIRGFMVQAGDPLTRDSSRVDDYGTGGPGYTIPAEIVPDKTHKKGALAAARRGDRINPSKASSGSQFYIVQDPENCAHLDGEYTIFGEVVEGLNVVDKIASEPTDERDRPRRRVVIVKIEPAI